jgi:cell division protease FtsH
MKKKQNNLKNYYPYIILGIIMVVTFILFNMSQYKVNKFTYDELVSKMSKDEIKEITVTPKSGGGVYYIEGKLKSYSKTESFKVNVPLSETVIAKILKYSDENNFKVNTNSNPENSSIVTILANVVPLLLLVGAMIFLFTRLSSGNNKSMDFGRSRAKLYADEKKAKFIDVAGLKEEKEEVKELIDFLKNPKKFQKLGARIPKGVLLVGPPGTGKTLLARAVAGEADVPFFYISGSDFVELFVGVGASRVRDMFKQAKHSAPCLIFIDEIDAVGRQRGTGLGGGHDEREQTLNQLLAEMDGFGANEGIIIIAATNRPDVLDPALLRPGRFDRQVMVNLPDVHEREEILGVHARGKIFEKSVNLKNISKRTPGFSGADLENLLNEAALLAVRRNKNEISMSEIDEATDRVLLGPAKVSRKVTDCEKYLVSIHEAGHAVIGLKLENANVVHKITIIPRGMAGGYTMMLPKEEKGIATKNELLDMITGLLGGRVAEELFIGEVSTGASDDFGRATKIARSMVTEYGMSDLGPIQFEAKSEGVFLGRDYVKSKNFSDQVALEIDKETRKIIDSCHTTAKKVLKENEKLVKLISDALIERETLTKEEIDELVETGTIKDPEEEKVDTKPEEKPKKRVVRKPRKTKEKKEE